VLVEVVRRLCLVQPKVPPGEQFLPRQVAQVEVFLAQEFVGHGRGSFGRTLSANATMRECAWLSGKASIS